MPESFISPHSESNPINNQVQNTQAESHTVEIPQKYRIEVAQPLKTEDTAQIIEMFNEIYWRYGGVGFQRDFLESQVQAGKNSPDKFIIIRDELSQNKIVATAAIAKSNSYAANVYFVATDVKHRRQGLATRLYFEAIRYAKSIGIGMIHTTPLVNMYELGNSENVNIGNYILCQKLKFNPSCIIPGQFTSFANQHRGHNISGSILTKIIVAPNSKTGLSTSIKQLHRAGCDTAIQNVIDAYEGKFNIDGGYEPTPIGELESGFDDGGMRRGKEIYIVSRTIKSPFIEDILLQPNYVLCGVLPSYYGFGEPAYIGVNLEHLKSIDPNDVFSLDLDAIAPYTPDVALRMFKLIKKEMEKVFGHKAKFRRFISSSLNTTTIS